MINIVILFIYGFYVENVNGTFPIQIPQYDSGLNMLCQPYASVNPCANGLFEYYIIFISNKKMNVTIYFTRPFTQIPQILLSNTYDDKTVSIENNGYIIEAQEITKTSFSLIYTLFTTAAKYSLNVQWLAIQDQTVCIHYVCLKATAEIQEYQQQFNQSYNWINEPLGAIFITGEYGQKFINSSIYSMGVNITRITIKNFTYTLIYEAMEYNICAHSIFTPNEFQIQYPYMAEFVTNVTKVNVPANDQWCQFQLQILSTNINPSVYIAGYTSFKQIISINQRIYIDFNISSWVPGNYTNTLMWGSQSCQQENPPSQETGVLRIQYVPLLCEKIAQAKISINETGSYCECQIGYYFQNFTSYCQKCSAFCIECNLTPNNCISCGPNQQLNSLNTISSCSCKQTYYFISDTNCEPCDNTCVNCVSKPNFCTSCGPNQSINRNNGQCSCSDGQYLISGTSCGQCLSTCLTCIYSPEHCTRCPANSYLNQTDCYCNPGSFRGYGADCLQCNITCLSCKSLDFCTSCQKGYYLDQVSCHKCDRNCQTCINYSTQCQTCRSNANLDNNNQCICKPGYYMDTTSNCSKCDKSCQNCIGPLNSQCTDCSYGKTLINNYCVCLNSQYIDGQGNCQECNNECATCRDDSTCLTCKPNLNNYYSEGQCLSCKEKAAMTVDICNYADCGDQVWTKGEQCDDGNSINRDGCSDCKIDRNYKCVNVLLYKSFCYTCPEGCAECILKTQDKILCHQCQTGYYLENDQCSLCSKNCVTCSNFRQCLTCLVLGFQPNTNGICPQCEDTAGFYTIINQCQTKCGDSIIAGIEECDDGNSMNGDGCSITCTLEEGYILQNGKPYQIPIPNSSVQYANSTALTNFTVATNQNDVNLCSFLSLTIDNYNTSAYNYNIVASQNPLTEEVLCQLSLNLTESLSSTQLIHFKIPYAKQSSRRLLEYLYREIIIIPRTVIVYSHSQAAQAQSVQSTSGTFTTILYFVGPGTVFLGGFECFFRILDILAWINNLYFINIQYPLNVGVFFQNSGWASVQLIPQFIQFNQPGDPYYTESPSKFMDLGVDPLFINNAYQSLSIILVIFVLHILTRIGNSLLQLCQIRRIQNLDLSEIRRQDRIHFLYNKLLRFNENFLSHLIQGLNLAFLDLVLAAVMQLLYFKTNYLRHYPVLISTVLAFLSIIFIIFMITQSIRVSRKHHTLLQTKTYETRYGVLYEEINKKSRLALNYSVFNLLRKTLFIINLIIFYNSPLFQTLFSCIISLINIVLILYENPFETRKALISNIVPDFCIFGLMLISSFLALDDQISQLSTEIRFKIGWVMLGLIAVSICIQLFYVLQSFSERSLLIYKSIME